MEGMFLPERAVPVVEAATQYEFSSLHEKGTVAGKRRVYQNGRIEYVNAPMEAGAPGHRAGVLVPVDGEAGFVHLTLYGQTEDGYSMPQATTKCRIGNAHKRAAEWTGWKIH
jgi:hypothetical protein